MTARPPNVRLRALLDEASWTGRGLAEAVNGAGRESGLVLTYGRAAVCRWLAGTRPPARIAVLVAEVLTRRIGRPVAIAETGLTGLTGLTAPEGAVPVLGDRCGVRQLVELCAADADPARRPALRHTVYHEIQLAAPSRAEETPARPAARNRPGPSTRFGLSRAEMVETMTAMFSRADAAFGGGHTRTALVAYLAGDVTLWLRTHRVATVPDRLLSSAALLVCLAGSMCSDEHLHGLARRYQLASLGLARESGDGVTGAIVLRGMSEHAYGLGHLREAHLLAERAAEQHSWTAHMTAAFLIGQLAVTTAANGDRDRALAQLREAERHLAKADPGDSGPGAYHPAQLARHQAEVLTSTGDVTGAIGALKRSLRHHPPSERRSRALTAARLAELQIRVGLIEAACVTAQGFCRDYPCLRSARVTAALELLRACLAPYRRTAAARAMLDRLAASAEASPRPAGAWAA
ncbi:tol-pal system YbgF family protein [Kitasatospora sp. NPDC088548]|uniref:tetratricopeptide repeat protein n=1 Tax=Kitasatospora sp. NPDC088548 TaxID=3364075 RepID=UPI003808246D